MSDKTFKIPTVEEVDDRNIETSFSKFKKLDSGKFTCVKEKNSTEAISCVSSFPTSSTTSAEVTSSIESASTSEKPLSTKNSQRKTPAEISSSSNAVRAVIVNGRQKGNPLLKYLRNVPWEWGETAADFVMGAACCGLFLSVKFHKLHPEYIHERFKKIGKSFALQILFLQIDVEEIDNVLRELNGMCFMAGWTLILTWSAEETAEYIESFKIYENKPCEFLMAKEKQDADDRSKLIDLLTSFPSVNRSDAENLIDAFGSLKNISEARVEDLALCQGVGSKKAQRLYDALGRPFSGVSLEKSTKDKCGVVAADIFRDDCDIVEFID